MAIFNRRTTWNNFGAVTSTNALLITSTTQVRYQPNGQNGETATFTYRAWDQTSGTASTNSTANYATTASNGGTTAFSSNSATASMVVSSVNDAPTITNGYTHTLTSTNEDTNSGGTLASAILTGAAWADIDTGAISGLAITDVTGAGTWQYSTDGTTWNNFGAVTSTNALLITSSTQVRYQPNGQNGETATFTYRAWDQTSGTASTNSTANYATTASNGGTTAFSSNSATASMVITSVNDAPTITNGYTHTLTSTNEDTNSSGTLASAILTGAAWADIDTGAVSGLAITGVTGNGIWQYSTDGTTWNNFGVVTSTNALLITSTTQVRYQPNGQNGETATLTYRAWDQTSGTASTNSTANYATTASNGGTTAFSSNTATASMVVTSVNDAPVLDNSGNMTLNPITEDDTSNSGQSVASIIASASGDRITDVDSGAIEGIAITSSTNGNGYWEYSTDNGTTWSTVGAVSDGSALLLRNTDWLRFVPDGQNATTGDITFRAWDQTSGTVGTKVDASVHGGTTAFSTATEVASITVATVNDAPIANSDTATAVEAGGTNNGNAGTNPSGNVLTNDTDVDAGDTKTVTGVMAGVHALATGPVSSPVNGAFGSITIAADGSYTYTIDNTHAAVQALRTSANTLQDVFTYTMRDTAGSISTSQITITIQGSNDAPVAVVDTAIAVEAGGTNNGTTGTNPTGNVLANDTDPDSVANGETQTITGVAAGVHALASGSVATSLNGNYGSIVLNADGTYSYTVNNNHAAIQALNAGDSLYDVFTYTVTDTAGATSSTQITITIQGSNDAPVASSIETSAVAYVENDGARTITSTLALADVDNASLSSAVIQITGNYVNGEDLLSFAHQNGISGSWDANTGRLTLTGTASIAQYEAALRSVRYTNLSDEPNTTTRTVSFSANDGNLSSNTQTRDIAITSVNDAPVISVDAGDSDSSVLNETNTSLSSSGTLSALDLDPSDVVTAQVTSVTSGGVTTGLLSNNAGLLNMLSVNANVISSGNTTGTILWTFNSGSEAFNYLAAGETLTLTYTISATDSQFASDTQQVTITITGTNDDPIVTIGGGDSAAETLGVTGSTLTTGGSLSVADIDRTDVVTAAVSNFVKSGDLTGLTLSDSQLQAMLGLNANVISNTQQSGTINWTFDSAGYTFGYLAAGQSITLTYTITVTDSQGQRTRKMSS